MPSAPPSPSGSASRRPVGSEPLGPFSGRGRPARAGGGAPRPRPPGRAVPPGPPPRLAASLTQSCVVTREPIAAHVDEPFEVMFMPELPESAPDEEVELGPGELDVVFYDGAVIDLGTAIADTLALSLDPYPRSASAEAALKEVGVLSEAEAGPFAVLAKLKKNDET